MVTSGSIAIAEKTMGSPYYYSIMQAVRILLSASIAVAVAFIPTERIKPVAPYLFMAAMFMLVMVLVPGVGRTVNGATRWLALGPITIQASEIAKLAAVIYLADYINRHQTRLVTFKGFISPLLLMGVAAFLMLLEPDFGAGVVMFAVGLTMLFLSGVRSLHLALVGGVLLALASFLVVSQPYRLERLTAFLDPWADQFDSGYQLTQALIAFGRGEVFGVGLGSSIQKLFYLPEAHTDFLFAVIAEELGLVGGLAVIGLFLVLAIRGLRVGFAALAQNRRFPAFIAIGITSMLTIQAFINIGVNMGMLPTKGLTLPFISYGGNSLLMTGVAVGLLIRVNWENTQGDV